MTTIQSITARQIIDSRANPTIEVDVQLTDNTTHRAAVPSGASTGVHEAVELRDGDASFNGLGVTKAVQHVNTTIAQQLIGKNPTDQSGIDAQLNQLDGTPNKANLGANAILGVSMAICRAAAHLSGMPLHDYIAKLAGTSPRLPVPCMNVINGGKHAGNALAFQEFMIAPRQATTFSQALQMGCETYHALKKRIKDAYGKDAINVGDEGGFAPPLDDPKAALDLLIAAIKDAGYSEKIMICMDAAASEFYKDELYDIGFKGTSKPLTANQLIEHYRNWCEHYPLISIEDPFDQDDLDSWSSLLNGLPKSVQIVGDDLTVTNVERIKLAIEHNACNSLLLKINQIGTISQAISAAQLARTNGWTIMVSHRSGETEDTFIADLAVGLGCGQIKSGAPTRSERVAKYNQLLRIEQAHQLPFGW